MRTSLVNRLAAVGLLLALAAPMSSPSPVRAADAPCGDVQLIFARGSNQDLGDIDFSAVNRDLTARIDPAGVIYSAYQLGEDDGHGGFQYEAQGSLEVLAQAPFPLLPENAYYNSVEEGRQELVAYLTDRAAGCPGEVYVLSGWSQGAQVIGEGLFGLDEQVRNRVAHVALFGDPVLLTATDSRSPSHGFRLPHGRSDARL